MSNTELMVEIAESLSAISDHLAVVVKWIEDEQTKAQVGKDIVQVVPSVDKVIVWSNHPDAASFAWAEDAAIAADMLLRDAVSIRCTLNTVEALTKEVHVDWRHV